MLAHAWPGDVNTARRLGLAPFPVCTHGSGRVWRPVGSWDALGKHHEQQHTHKKRVESLVRGTCRSWSHTVCSTARVQHTIVTASESSATLPYMHIWLDYPNIPEITIQETNNTVKKT